MIRLLLELAPFLLLGTIAVVAIAYRVGLRNGTDREYDRMRQEVIRARMEGKLDGAASADRLGLDRVARDLIDPEFTAIVYTPDPTLDPHNLAEAILRAPLPPQN